jgi:predicted O-methyltransferase YrrM
MNPESVLNEIESLSRSRYYPIIGPLKGGYLVEAIRSNAVKRVLELGTCIGYSAILIAKELPGDGRLVTIEIDPRYAGLAEKNIRKAGLAEKVKILVGDAARVLSALDSEFDMVFLDTAHHELLDYLKKCERMLKKGGLVFTDNVKLFARSMGDFLDYVRNSGKYNSRYIDVGHDGVEISIKLF